MENDFTFIENIYYPGFFSFNKKNEDFFGSLYIGSGLI